MFFVGTIEKDGQYRSHKFVARFLLFVFCDFAPLLLSSKERLATVVRAGVGFIDGVQAERRSAA